MGIPDIIRSWFRKEPDREEEERLRLLFKKRCDLFKALLSANKRALETMAGLEEAARGEHRFSMTYVRGACTTLLAAVFNMVRCLNGLSGDKYTELADRLQEIRRNIQSVISPKEIAKAGPFVLPVEETGISVAHETGGKMAGLGEAKRLPGMNIPDGFVVTASGFRRFFTSADLQEEINRRLQMTDFTRFDALLPLSASLQRLVMETPLPADLEEDILRHYARLEERYGKNVRLAVRSSAIGEDVAGAGFAGQFRSVLNVAGGNLIKAYKEVAAGKYSVSAIVYRVNRGIPDDEMPMCVGCLVMLDALSGGVAYSKDPLHPERGVSVNAVPGLPKTVVDGSGGVDVFYVSREKPLAVLERFVARKSVRLSCSQTEGLVETRLSEEEGALPALKDAQVLEVAEAALRFEEFYGTPQDMEWAYAPDGRLIVLQTRDLPGASVEYVPPPPPQGSDIVMEGGVSASPGIGCGPVRIVRHEEDLLRFSQGSVLVLESAHARWAPLLEKAAAVVSEFGGVAGHLASVARECGVPALFGLEGAAKNLKDGDIITVDALARRIFSGRVEELLAGEKEPPRISFSNSPVYDVLQQAVEHIVPLHLLDPESPDFSPKNCITLHDITRFCHEKSVEEMFRSDDPIVSGRFGKQLRYKGGKLQYFVVNLDQGFCGPVESRYVDLERICCIPMLALWEGMIAVPWTGPPGGARSFFAVVAESAANPDLEITSASPRLQRNYFLVDRWFCNLQASFGYHFCTVEAHAGPQEQENYISFHFKGGAANLARRRMRIRVLGDILAENGFLVDIKEDALSARTEVLEQEDAVELLNILGYLLIHTRQVDAAMGGEESLAVFGAALRKGVAQALRVCAGEKE